MVTPGADDRELVEQNGLSRWFFDPLRADPRLRADEAVRRSTEGSRRRLAHRRGGTLAVGVPRHRTVTATDRDSLDGEHYREQTIVRISSVSSLNERGL